MRNTKNCHFVLRHQDIWAHTLGNCTQPDCTFNNPTSLIFWASWPRQYVCENLLINQLTKLQSNDHNSARLITPSKAAFTLHTTDRLYSGHAQSLVHCRLQLFDRQSLVRRLEMLDDPSIRSSSDHQYYPAASS